MKQTYIRCPRCELNYILKKDKFCKVCKTEMKALGTLGAEENLDLELCPICKVNYINPDEDICAQCAKEKESEEGENTSSNKFDGEWGAYDNQEEDEGSFQAEENGDMVSISSLDDTPLADDEMDLDISDEDDESNEEEEGEENSNEDDDFDINETFDDEDEDDEEDDEEDDYDDEDEKPRKKK